MGFTPGMQEFFNIHESVSVKHHIKKLNNKNHMVISIDAAKAFEKTQTHLGLKNKQTKKTLQKFAIEELICLNIIKAIYDKPRANIIFMCTFLWVLWYLEYKSSNRISYNDIVHV